MPFNKIPAGTIIVIDGAEYRSVGYINGRHQWVAVAALISQLRSKLQNNARTGMDCKTAASAAGLTVSRVVELRRTGSLPTIFHLDGDRPLPLIARKAVEEIASRHAGSIKVQDTAVQLGISYHGVEQLMCLGVLESVVVPFTRKGAEEPRVCRASLAKLIDRIEQAGVEIHADDFQPLTKLLGVVPGIKAWGPILHAIAQGDIPCALAGRGKRLADRLTVSPAHAQKLQAMRFDRSRYPQFAFDDFMSKTDATEALNLMPKDTVDLLAPWPTLKKVRTVPVAAVEQLVAKFVSVPELSHRIRTPANVAWRVAAEAGILRESPAGFDRKAVDQAFGRRAS